MIYIDIVISKKGEFMTNSKNEDLFCEYCDLMTKECDTIEILIKSDARHYSANIPEDTKNYALLTLTKIYQILTYTSNPLKNYVFFFAFSMKLHRKMYEDAMHSNPPPNLFYRFKTAFYHKMIVLLNNFTQKNALRLMQREYYLKQKKEEL
jgi:hypothetical protein